MFASVGLSWNLVILISSSWILTRQLRNRARNLPQSLVGGILGAAVPRKIVVRNDRLAREIILGWTAARWLIGFRDCFNPVETRNLSKSIDSVPAND
jgi:hypothetical protein